jgi:hypothetical protein
VRDLLSFRIQAQSRLRDAIQSVMAITDASNWFWQRISVSGIALKDRFVHALRTLS